MNNILRGEGAGWDRSEGVLHCLGRSWGGCGWPALQAAATAWHARLHAGEAVLQVQAFVLLGRCARARCRGLTPWLSPTPSPQPRSSTRCATTPAGAPSTCAPALTSLPRPRSKQVGLCCVSCVGGLGWVGVGREQQQAAIALRPLPVRACPPASHKNVAAGSGCGSRLCACDALPAQRATPPAHLRSNPALLHLAHCPALPSSLASPQRSSCARPALAAAPPPPPHLLPRRAPRASTFGCGAATQRRRCGGWAGSRGCCGGRPRWRGARACRPRSWGRLAAGGWEGWGAERGWGWRDVAGGGGRPVGEGMGC